jgi:hypothetical protein
MTAPLVAQDETTQVYVSQGELNYVGGLDGEANRKLFALYEGLKDKPRVLSIRSPGGSVDSGIELGTWVREHKLDLQVLEFCLSSCANYVFPAGARKFVSNFAVVGYHGGPSSGKISFDESVIKQLDALPPEQRAALLEQLPGFLGGQSRKEVDYFKTLGVRADISTLGQQDKYQHLYKVDPRPLGWTYSLEDFARLGVRDIVVINPPWRPGSSLYKLAFVRLPLDEQ